MSLSMSEANDILRHVWLEPRFVAEMEWMREYGLSVQLEEQMGRGAMEHFVATGQHLEPDKKLTLTLHEMPDWDWWEPTSQWRRLAARDRGDCA